MMELDALIAQITDEVCRRMQLDEPGGPVGGLAANIEYTLMDPRLRVEDIERMCDTAKAKNLACVCVAQWFVDLAKQRLAGSDVKVCTCVGLPGGNSATAAKYAEVKEAVKNGADEVDIPVNMELAKCNDFEELKNDLEEAMVPAKNKAAVKAVIELGQLNDDQLEKNRTGLYTVAGVDLIAVSSILSGKPHDLSEVGKVASYCGKTKIKAVGDVKDSSRASELVAAGVMRIGTSSAGSI